MLLLAVVLYFFIACLIGWIVLFPESRACIAQAIAWMQTVGSPVKQHYAIFLAVSAAICMPPILALLAGDKSMLGGFDGARHEINVQIAELLRGEQLVPPAEPPPLVFATQEVWQLRPMLVSASRNWTLLNADYSRRLLLAFRIMKEKHGYDMAILEGYRSPERQTILAGMGPHVTNAKAFQSWHQYGLAADCAFLREGKLIISEKDPWAMRGYQLYGDVAESLGLTWGGRWKMMDFGHSELHLPGVMNMR